MQVFVVDVDLLPRFVRMHQSKRDCPCVFTSRLSAGLYYFVRAKLLCELEVGMVNRLSAQVFFSPIKC